MQKQTTKEEIDRSFDYYRTVNYNAKGLNDRCLQYLSHKQTNILHTFKLGLQSCNTAKNNLTPQSCLIISQAKWHSLAVLTIVFKDVASNSIGNIGCKYLSRGYWSCLQNLDLDTNNIGSQGLLHLSKHQWKSIKYLSMDQNNINSLVALLRLYGKQLKKFSIIWNKLNGQAIKPLFLKEMPLIEEILLRVNLTKERNDELIRLLRIRFNRLNMLSY